MIKVNDFVLVHYKNPFYGIVTKVEEKNNHYTAEKDTFCTIIRTHDISLIPSYSYTNTYHYSYLTVINNEFMQKIREIKKVALDKQLSLLPR